MNKYLSLSIDEIEKILSHSKDDKYAWEAKGILVLGNGDDDRAINAFMKALEIDNKFIEAWIQIGIIKMLQKKYVEALEKFDTALSIDSSYSGLYYLLANAQFKIGAYQTAIDNCYDELRCDDKYINCYRLMSLAKQKLGYFEEAIKDLLYLIRTSNKKSPKDYYYLGKCYYEIKDYSSAKKYFKKSLTLYQYSTNFNTKFVKYLERLLEKTKPSYTLRDFDLGNFGDETEKELSDIDKTSSQGFNEKEDVSSFGKIPFELLKNRVLSEIYDNPYKNHKINWNTSALFKSKSIYPVSVENIQALLDNYFADFQKDNIKQLTEKIKTAGIGLNELTSCVSEFSKINEVILSNNIELDKDPTQSILLEYSIETFVNINWDDNKKSEERVKTIERIKTEIENQYVNDVLMNSVEEERSWHSSSYYNDDLDWDQQSDEFYNDVL